MFKNNRKILSENLKNNSIAIIPCGEMKIRSNDTEYCFRPNSNFYYLSGFSEPDSILLLIKSENCVKSIMCLRPKDKLKEIWTGFRLGVEDAPEKLDIEQAKDVDHFDQLLEDLLPGIENLYFDLTDLPLLQKISTTLSSVTNLRGNKKNIPDHFIHLPKLIKFMRLKKNNFEIEEIKKACAITNLAHREAIKRSQHCSNEREILALIEATFTHHGATYSSYNSIIAGGKNALCLHYVENNKPLNPKDLILIDAGAEYNYYASDVTRTFPIGKSFSPEQKLIYEIVLNAQEEVIKNAKSGKTLTDLHVQATELMLDGLLEFKILKGSKDEILEKKTMKEIYPHGTSHFMGMDVHDQNPRYIDHNEVKLENGMIFTVEPGLYLYDNLEIPEQFKGIAIRIEDDILIENDLSFNLTKEIPKTIADIEELKREDTKRK